MLIRQAKTEDVDALVAQGVQFSDYLKFDVPAEAGSIRKVVSEYRDHPSVIMLVAEEEGKVIGMALAVSAPCYWNNAYTMGEEALWWIAPEHRGSAGLRLFAAMESEAKLRGWYQLVVGVSCDSPGREKVTAFYGRRGYTPWDNRFVRRL